MGWPTDNPPPPDAPTDAAGWKWNGTKWVPPEERAPLSIYDLLRRLISGEPWAPHEREQAVELIDTLERNAVLGTRAAELTTPGERRNDK